MLIRKYLQVCPNNQFFIFYKRNILRWPYLYRHFSSNVDDQIAVHEMDKNRNVSRLPDSTRKAYITKESPHLSEPEDFTKENLSQTYAFYGKKSGINPGIMWPSKEEIKDLMEYEKTFHQPLDKMLSDIKQRKAEEAEYFVSRQKEVEENMMKLEGWKKAVKDKEAKLEAEAKVQKQKRSDLIEEVRQYLGYNIDPKDPKFEEVVKKKQEEEKQALKALKKKEKQEKLLARLLKVAEEEEGNLKTQNAPASSDSKSSDKKSDASGGVKNESETGEDTKTKNA